MDYKICINCNNYFYRTKRPFSRISNKSWIKKKFCCKECYYAYLKGKPSNRKPFLGKKHSLETKAKISAKLTGSNLSNKACHNISLAKRGNKNPAWKGGITPKSSKERKSQRYTLWRKSVFKRDDYTCQECFAKNGNGKAVILHAHHIKSWAKYPELRYIIDNGITLCKDCHKKTDSYLKG